MSQEQNEKTDAITIRGTSDGLVITFGEGPFGAILSEMKERLESKASFFLGGRVALRVGDRPLSVEQLQALGQAIQECGVTLWAVEGDHPTTQLAVDVLGLETHLRSSTLPPPPQPEKIPREEMVGVVVRGTLRSGQAVNHAGHVIIIGDVNPGAEIVASGDVIVWGKLRGIVHAGAIGDEGAVVCALQLVPSQIRIGSHIARPPDRGRLPKDPEIASVQDGGIVVERWEKKR